MKYGNTTNSQLRLMPKNNKALTPNKSYSTSPQSNKNEKEKWKKKYLIREVEAIISFCTSLKQKKQQRTKEKSEQIKT